MVLEQVRAYRLGPRGGASLACHDDGVTLGGVALVSVALDDDGHRRCDVRSAAQIGWILGAAYGPQPERVAERLHRGLRRVAAALEKGDLAGAGIEAVMLRLPDLDTEGLSKLAAINDLEKGGASWEDEPRVPAGQPEGGQWTAGGGTVGSPTVGRRPRAGLDSRSSEYQAPSEAEANAESGEVTAVSPIRQSRRQNSNGFYVNTAGGGVFYIPSVSGGRQIRPTEVHALDANAFHVSWVDGVIKLKDANGSVYAVAGNTGELKRFNASTGRMLGVRMYAFPDALLAAPDPTPTAAEQRHLAAERAAFEAGRQVSEHSWSGRVTSVAVGGAAALPLVALLPEVIDVGPAALELNEQLTGTELAERLGVFGERDVALSGAKEPIQIPGTGRVRIPDGLDKKLRLLSEVKNSLRQGLTRQLRDYLAFCRQEGYDFDLYVRRTAHLTKPLRDAIARGEIRLKYIPGTI